MWVRDPLICICSSLASLACVELLLSCTAFAHLTAALLLSAHSVCCPLPRDVVSHLVEVVSHAVIQVLQKADSFCTVNRAIAPLKKGTHSGFVLTHCLRAVHCLPSEAAGQLIGYNRLPPASNSAVKARNRRNSCVDDDRPFVTAPTTTCESLRTNTRLLTSLRNDMTHGTAVLRALNSSTLMCSSSRHGWTR